MESKAHVVRAAFDIGSGRTKLQVAVVDRKAGLIKTQLHGAELSLKFAVDFKSSTNGELSERIQTEGLEKLQKLLRIAQEHGATECFAIATEVFRKARNGAQFIEKIRKTLNLPVTLVSQHQEAVLGYRSAAALYNETHPAAGPITSWDSGGASFQFARQITNGSLSTYMGALGASVCTAMAVVDVQNRPFSVESTPNPFSLYEVRVLTDAIRSKLDPKVPDWLQGEVVAIGGPNSIFSLVCDLLEVRSFTVDDVWACLIRCSGKVDAFLARLCCERPDSDPPSMVMPKLTLLHTVMSHCGVSRVQYIAAVGSCAGMLITEDDLFGTSPWVSLQPSKL
ncbi:exopolyphosphatase / guanosine-5prime-triphosphate [Diplonema papillatum]|nr:exopolyphosphatase / guanosine-5prime-triphosphate [Diplonema papillatum]